MSKRFTETDKWKDSWFCSLKPIEKLVWEYLRDNCDNAGFFEMNHRQDAFIIGITEEQYLGAYEGLMRGLIKSTDGRKIWLRKFLFHQKNLPLNPANNAHKQIIGIIKENQKIFDYEFDYLGAYEGLFSPIGKGKDKGIVKVIERGTGENLTWGPKQIQEFFSSSQVWAEGVCMNKKIEMSQLVKFQAEFIKDITDSTQLYPNHHEAIKHFNNWLKKKLQLNSKKDPATEQVGKKDYSNQKF